jgi:periplasmic copper chaperone A
MTETARTAVSVFVGAVAFFLAQPSVVPSLAADYDVGSIHIAQPWSRATPKGAMTGASYMTITNKGTTPDRVSCVSSNASAQCQIHSMTMEGGVMKMRPVEGGLEIKPGETVTLAPSGFHMMLVNLKHPLEVGQTVKATLKFDKAGWRHEHATRRHDANGQALTIALTGDCKTHETARIHHDYR